MDLRREMTMRWLRRISAVFVAGLAGASITCSGVTEPTAANYQLVLHQTLESRFCQPGEPGYGLGFYCFTDVATDTTFAGSITHFGRDSVIVNIGGDALPHGLASSLRFDSTASGPFYDSSGSRGCHSVSLRVVMRDSRLQGSWSHGVECHGLGATSGTLTGERN
jgi:hypothetical protein